jgi:predicted GNAT family acetyltransferase
VQGLTEEVRLFENALEKMGKAAEDTFDYDLMDLDNLPSVKSLSSGPKNLALRAPQLTDLDAIAPLQAAYEHEEVLPKGSVFSHAASRVNIANIISGGRILAAELDGRLVGKINVSAISFTKYQVGGVYVHPDFRGMGIARRMAAEFITSLINEGRGVTLFVKKTNVPARGLYRGLGFRTRGDYRITYY